MAEDRWQSKELARFQQIIQAGKLSHAYLFTGGAGSFEVALYLAQSLFCDAPQDNLPCQHCRPCRLIASHDFSDLKIIEPQGQLIKTETVRSLLREFSSSGFEQEAQFFIIKEADKMHPNAANSLLKYIEEPQSHSYMILLTQDDSKILPTIKSRTQVFHFQKDTAYMVQLLQEKGLLKNQAELLADLAKDTHEALALAEQKKILDLIKACERFVSYLFQSKQQAYLEVSRLAQSCPDKAEQAYALDLLALLVAKNGQLKAVDFMEKLYLAREMWRSNVNFQNALEYMVIK